MIRIESQIICYTPDLSVIINKRSESAVLSKILIKICMQVVAKGSRSHLALKVQQAKQNVCLHNLTSPSRSSLQVASTFVDIMVAAKKRYLEVGSKNSVIWQLSKTLRLKDTGKRGEVTQLWVKE